MDIQEATPIKLTAEERSALEAMVRSPKTEHGLVERARSQKAAINAEVRSE
jgi:hypothetical protein